MNNTQYFPNTYPVQRNQVPSFNQFNTFNQYVPINNHQSPPRNYIIPKYCKTYNAYLMDQGFQMGNTIKIPQMFDAPNFMNSNYMFDEIVDVRDENRDHSIDLIRNMMKVVLE